MSGTPTTITGAQIRDGSVSRPDLNTTVTSQAVITKVVASSNMHFTSTGVDAGTGDVTIDLSDTSIVAGTYTKLVIDVKGRATASGGALLATDLPTSGVTPGQYTKLTVDTYGRVTSGASLSAGDIPTGSTAYVQNQAGAQQSGNFWLSGWGGALEHRSYNAAGTQYISWAAPSSLAANYTFKMPASYGANNQLLSGDGAGNLAWTNAGTVTSVQVAAPTQFNVTGGPITGSGTITMAWVSQAANTVLAAPNGSSGAPTFRSLLAADIPGLPASAITSGVFASGLLGSGTANSTTFLRGDGTWATSGGGSVTSVGLSLPSMFTVTVSPVTTSGTLTAVLASQSANTVLAAPNGAPGAPSFRTLLAADIPSLSSTYVPVSGGIAMSGSLTMFTSTAGTAGLIVPHGVAPSAPVDGSIWTTTAGLYVQVNAVTKLVNTTAATVSSVGLTAPAEFTVTGSPITTSGSLSMTWASQTANKFLASPNGSSGTPAFRAMAAADVASGSTYYVQNQSSAAQATTDFWVSGTGRATEFRAYNAAGTFYVGLKAPTAIAANYTLTLPNGYGASGQVLTTDGAGATSWSTPAEHAATMPRASAINSLALTTTNTSIYLTTLIPNAQMLLTTASEFEVQILQTATGSLRFVLYTEAYAVIAYSAVIVNPAAGVRVGVISTFASGTSYTLSAGTKYFIGILTNQNSPYLSGVTGSSNTNQTPYSACKVGNIGSTTPPATLTGVSESLLRIYARIKS